MPLLDGRTLRRGPFVAAIVVVIGAIFGIVFSRIVEADKKAAEAKALAVAARADTARLERRIAQMEQLQSGLLARDAKAQERLTQLEAAARPRTISPDQVAQIGHILKGFAGQEVEVYDYGQDYESSMLAKQVASCLAKAGLKPHLATVTGMASQGFAVAVHDKRSVPRLAVALRRAFRSAGLEMDSFEFPDQVKEGKFMIFVGAKGAKR
jgi:hypothetical protein